MLKVLPCLSGGSLVEGMWQLTSEETCKGLFLHPGCFMGLSFKRTSYGFQGYYSLQLYIAFLSCFSMETSRTRIVRPWENDDVILWPIQKVAQPGLVPWEETVHSHLSRQLLKAFPISSPNHFFDLGGQKLSHQLCQLARN